MQTIDRESKQKLTLGISRDVIEKAKAAGLNISAITEDLLRVITYQPGEANTRNDVVKAYEALFGKMSQTLDEYGNITFFEAGKMQQCSKIDGKEVLTERKIYYYLGVGLTLGGEEEPQYHVKDVLARLHEPRKILYNFIIALIQSAEHNKERIKELEFALRFVKTLSEEDDETRLKGDNNTKTLQPVQVGGQSQIAAAGNTPSGADDTRR